jgi:hypothetical protein
MHMINDYTPAFLARYLNNSPEVLLKGSTRKDSEADLDINPGRLTGTSRQLSDRQSITALRP